jgi:hypothetical protein
LEFVLGFWFLKWFALQIKRMIASYVGENDTFEKQYASLAALHSRNQEP